MTEQIEATGTAPEGEDGGKAAAAPEPDRLMEAFEAFRSDVGSRLDRIEQARPAAEEEPEEEQEPELNFEFTDEDFNEQGQLSHEAQMREFASMMRAIAREEQQPLIAEREQERRVTEADALEQRYPALRDDETQNRYIEMTVQAAQALGQPELAREPRFLEMVYLQDLGRQGVQAEVPAGSSPGAALERGGGAPPAQSQSSTDEEGDRIVAVSTKQRFRLGR